LSAVAEGGLERTINGSDRMRIVPELYTLPEEYEPDVWRALMREVRQGDVVADVGANIGLYTVAISKRIGPRGRMYAFEPEPTSVGWLRRHVDLNGLQSRVMVYACAVGAYDGSTAFMGGRGSESHVSVAAAPEPNGTQVPITRLDSVFKDGRLDVLKLDVEGFEEHVLRGAGELLNDPLRAPRVMFVEVHPYAWANFGVSSDSFLALMHDHGYDVPDLAGNTLHRIRTYGEIVARSRRVAAERPTSA